MGDVGKGAAVKKGGHSFNGLDKIGLQGVAEQCHQGSGHAGFFGQNGLALRREPGDDAIQAGTQIGQ